MSTGEARQPEPRPIERLDREAHLWLLRLRGSIPPELERSWRELLPAEERASESRLRVEEARRQHLAGRALLRTTLSRYAEVDPRSWRFRPGPKGKPAIAAPAGTPPLRFNLSHTRGLVACAVTLGLDVGIDVERPARRLSDPLALARHGFAPAERRALERLAGRARRELFFDLWTLKEAYVKARGAGMMSLPTTRLDCRIEPGGRIRLRLDPRLADRAEDWQVVLIAPTGEHRLAVAIRRGQRPDLTLATHELEPPATVRRLEPELVARTDSPPTAVGARPAAD